MKRIYTKQELFKPGSEQLILFGLLDEYPKEKNTNHLGHSRYHNLIEYCKGQYIYVTDPKSADIFVLPFKFRGTDDPVYKDMTAMAKAYKKQLWCFYNDDDERKYPIDDCVTLFRTSMSISNQLPNEKPLITVSHDFFNEIFLESPKLTVGFCGWGAHGRKPYLDFLEGSELHTDFIIRNGFGGSSDARAKYEFIKNIETNLFAFCYRGAGNFSYRFFEILSMGRIPVIVNTGVVIPFWDLVRTYNIGVIVDERDVVFDKHKIVSAVKEYYETNKDNLVEIQKNNRKLYETYFSPCGFLEHINEYI